MSPRPHRCAAAGALLLAVAGCRGPAPVVAPPPPRDLVVLALHPDGAPLGAAVVQSGGASAELAEAGASVDVRAGQPMPAPVVLPPDRIAAIFGEALAALPPPARRFVLYFDLGGDTLTAESRALIDEILTTVRERERPDVSIIGHTDTTGAAAANVTLGLRRATTVRDLLVQAGLDAALVEVASHGESNPLEPTPDSTENARNRRVEVTVR
ncbi:MAG: OmpA family protein [Vicinamibacterales bacterium]